MRLLAESIPRRLAATALTLYGTVGIGAPATLPTLASGPLYARFGIAAAKGASSTIPIVFFGGGDLAAAGLIASLARPGGNLTGFSICPTRSPHFAHCELTKRIYDGPAAQLRAWPSLSPRCGRKDSIPTTIR
jgi:hypothetical protein